MSINPNNPADFGPTLNGYTGQGAFRFWCQTVLPLVYDDSLSYYELLNKVVVYLNNVIEDVSSAEGNIADLSNAYNQLQDYVNAYFENLDVQSEIDLKLDEMASSGALSNLIQPYIPDLVTDWLTENVDPVGSAVVLNTGLNVSGAAADAGSVGKKAILQYPKRVDYSTEDSNPNHITCTTLGWSSLSDFEANRVYQLGNDYPNSFGLAFNGDYSSLLIIHPNQGTVSSVWEKTYMQFSQTHGFYIKIANSGWIKVLDLDATLSITGKAADAGAVGKRALLQYPKRVYYNTADSNPNHTTCDALGWTSITDFETNRIYQLGNDYPGTFGLAYTDDYSSLIVIHPNQGNTLSTWEKIYVQFSQTKGVYIKVAGANWFKLLELDSTLSISGKAADAGSVGKKAILQYPKRVDYSTEDSNPNHITCTTLGWSRLSDFEANRVYQLGNDYPDSFGLAFNDDYSSLLIIHPNQGVLASSWQKTYIQFIEGCMWIKTGSASWVDVITKNYFAENSSISNNGILIKDTISSIKIGLFGDSIVAGQGVSDWGQVSTQGEYVDLSEYNMSIEGFYKYTGTKSWGAKFSSYIESIYPNISVINNGIPTATLYKYYQILTDENGPIDSDVDIAIVCLGINSRNQSTSNIINQTKNIYNFFKNKNIPVFILSPLPAGDNSGKINNDNQLLETMKYALKNTVDMLPLHHEVENWCLLTDVSLPYDSNSSYNFLNSDNLHPTDLGHSITFNVIKSLLKV